MRTLRSVGDHDKTGVTDADRLSRADWNTAVRYSLVHLGAEVPDWHADVHDPGRIGDLDPSADGPGERRLHRETLMSHVDRYQAVNCRRRQNMSGRAPQKKQAERRVRQ